MMSAWYLVKMAVIAFVKNGLTTCTVGRPAQHRVQSKCNAERFIGMWSLITHASHIASLSIYLNDGERSVEAGPQMPRRIQRDMEYSGIHEARVEASTGRLRYPGKLSDGWLMIDDRWSLARRFSLLSQSLSKCVDSVDAVVLPHWHSCNIHAIFMRHVYAH